ncbi:hypothetical protein [Polaribacter sargassicola]|uniref:hypothetical protein n=1 Tax=Polaribacter sargassicola TaxID=2836891 RepID=UPI001F277C59|nr:hypothetical protein [Polaribacter sp. DS7-9]MCG1035280.1 hypothetical protein [Polaribacter sp. DS7-9]
MELFKKVYWLIYPLLIVVFILISEKVFNVENTVLSTSIAVTLSFILSPRVVMIDKQNGEEEQIKWLFFKKVINKEL